MMMRIRYKSSSIVSKIHLTSIHNLKHPNSLYTHLLVKDLCGSVSLEFSSCDNHRIFYSVESDDDRLRSMIEFEEHDYFYFEFDRVLATIMFQIIMSSKAHVEIAIATDNEGNAIGISFIPFDAVALFTTKDKTLFLSKDTRGKFVTFQIPVNHYIEFTSIGIGVKRSYFRRLAKSLRRIDYERQTDFLADKKMQKKVDFVLWNRKKDYLLLKYPKAIGWNGHSPTNSSLSESYLLYRSIVFKQFRKESMNYILNQINLGLKAVEDEIHTSGRIIVSISLVDYQKEWQRYKDGEISASELSAIIYQR